MNDTPEKEAPPQPSAEQTDQAAAKQRHQEALKHALERKRQKAHEAHQHHAAKPKFAPKFSPAPTRRGPRGG